MQISGVLLNVWHQGVLLTGESGVGKSELALNLIYQGHRLIADDMVALEKLDAQILQGSCPANIRDFLHIRDIGIINVRRILGEQRLQAKTPINLIINLLKFSPTIIHDPLYGMAAEVQQLLGIKIPRYHLVAKQGRNLAVLVEIIVRKHLLALQGYQAIDELQNRQLQNQLQNTP